MNMNHVRSLVTSLQRNSVMINKYLTASIIILSVILAVTYLCSSIVVQYKVWQLQNVCIADHVTSGTQRSDITRTLVNNEPSCEIKD